MKREAIREESYLLSVLSVLSVPFFLFRFTLHASRFTRYHGAVPNSLYRMLPSVNEVLALGSIQELLERYSRSFLVETINAELDYLREQITRGTVDSVQLERRLETLDEVVIRRANERLSPSLRSIINATGVLVFTNAGRSPLSPHVMEKVSEMARSYTNLEYDLDAGKRGHRDLHFEARVTRLMNCEAATVCNNAAAALLLILNTLASGKKVLVSRGELIEIGGSFRLPSIMEKSGAILKEVGTTNKTKPSDYADAIDEETALILRVHPSNYKVVGFTQRPRISDLVAISRDSGIPLLHDAGSGYLFRTEDPVLQEEPVVSESLERGCDLVCFSGDKLLGGPQAGLIVGRQELVSRIRKNPLMRAMRVDKLIYSALEWTLMEYEKGTFRESLPLWKLLSVNPKEIKKRALRIKSSLSSEVYQPTILAGFSLTGGGSAPEEELPTHLLALTSKRHSVNELERLLRTRKTPILTRIEEDKLVIDLRSVFSEQDEEIITALIELTDR